jgi:hypothetical protein
MSGTWQNEIRNIASGLLTLEVNVAIKPGMVAQKMPELPVALHVVIDTYEQALRAAGWPVTNQLLRAAAAHLRSEQGVTVTLLEQWFTPARPPEWSVDDRIPAALTNGAETFEAMQWAAFGALAGGSPPLAPDAPPPTKLSQVALARIRSNSRQLRAAAIMLEQQFSSGDAKDRDGRKAREEPDTAEPGAIGFDDRLKAVAAPPGSNAVASPEPRRLFGGVLEQTAAALFKHPRPAISVPPDLTLLIRKAWDVGLEEVKFQTSLQLDGDMVVRMADNIPEEHRAFLRDLHQQAVRDGTTQWKLLFQTAGELLRDTGKLLFGLVGGR